MSLQVTRAGANECRRFFKNQTQMSEKKQPYTQIRCVQYPVIIDGAALDRIGLFEVDFHSDDLPLRARMLRFVGYDEIRDLATFLDDINEAVFERPTLLYTDTVNLDEDEWGGTLYFPHPPILK